MSTHAEFQKLSEHIAALLDNEAISVAEASSIAARFIQTQLGCSFVAIWLLDRRSGKHGMRRYAGFDVATGERLTAAVRLPEAACGAYVDVLMAEGALVSDDCLADARLAAMREDHLLPNDIRASMDALIAFNGAPIAVVCCVQRGATRHWSPQELALLKRCAAEIALRRARRHSCAGAVSGIVTELVRKVAAPR